MHNGLWFSSSSSFFVNKIFGQVLSVHLFIMCLCAVVKASIYLWVCVLSWHLLTFACLFNCLCVCVCTRVCPWQLSIYMYLPLYVAEPLRSCWACISQKLSTCGLWAVSLLNSSWAGLSIQAPQNMIRWVQGPGREVTLCTLPDHHSVVDKRRECVCVCLGYGWGSEREWEIGREPSSERASQGAVREWFSPSEFGWGPVVEPANSKWVNMRLGEWELELLRETAQLRKNDWVYSSVLLDCVWESLLYIL